MTIVSPQKWGGGLPRPNLDDLTDNVDYRAYFVE